MLDDLLKKLRELAAEYKLISATIQTPKPAVAPTAITGSVGNKGTNTPADVLLVQQLFNKKANAGLSENGVCDNPLINAIAKFQQKIVGMAKPDGRIDPNGKTWKALAGSTVAPVVTPPVVTPPVVTPPVVETPAVVTPPANTTNIVPNNPIKKAVGDTSKAVNDKADVITIQQLLIAKGYSNVKATGDCDAATIAAIHDYQKTKMGQAQPDGRVDAGGSTWKSLSGQATTPASGSDYTGATGKYRPQDQQNDDWQSDTQKEQKLEDFFDSFSHIRVCINPGQSPEQYVEVVPSYEINSTRKKDPQGKDLPEPMSLVDWADKFITGKIGAVRKKLPWHARAGKATPPDITWYLNECVKQGAVPSGQLNAKGLRKFLDDTCVGVDCTGLVSQALNFLVDGNMDFDRKADDFNITGSITSGKKFATIASPNQLKAGDIMQLAAPKGGTYGHVRVVVDVDKMPDGSIQVRTVESGGGGENSGVGAVLWRYKDGATFDGLERSDNQGAGWAASSEHSSRSMKYIRWDKLETLPE